MYLQLFRNCFFTGQHSPMPKCWCLQIQTELGDSHINIVNALEVIVTSTNLALVLEYAQGGSLTHYVGQRWQHAQHTGSFLSEDESRYLFRVRSCHCCCVSLATALRQLTSLVCCSNSSQLWSTATSTMSPTGVGSAPCCWHTNSTGAQILQQQQCMLAASRSASMTV